MKWKDNYLDKLYYDSGAPGGYSGLNTLMRLIRKDKKRKKQFTQEYVNNWLEKQDVYSRHYPVRKKFERNKMMVYTIDEMWMADLIDVSALKTYNNEYCFILTVIDGLSRFGWAIPLKSKHGNGVATAFEKIFKQGRIPQRLITDAGKEFLNSNVKTLMKKNEVYLSPTTSDEKAFLVERWNRTLKEKMWKYFTAHGTFKYTDQLDNLVAAYNSSVHRSIDMAPIHVTRENFKSVWKHLYGKVWPGYMHGKTTAKFRYNMGDNVRISRVKGLFDKGYLPGFSSEIFTVIKRLPRSPPVYKLAGDDDEPLSGIFYEPELVRVIPQNDA